MNAHDKLSVPSIRGKPLQFETDISSDEQDDVFQSPPFGASHCNLRQISAPTNRMTSFSPLHSGQATAITRHNQPEDAPPSFQSPPFGASHCNNTSRLQHP